MTDHQSDEPPARKSVWEDAKVVSEILADLQGRVNDVCEEEGDFKPPPERVMALVADSLSLAEGIRTGAITVSQPRMATNLIEVATLLDQCGHSNLAGSFTNLLNSLSVNGLAAENCTFGRNRQGPGKP